MAYRSDMENRRENDTAEVSYGVCPRRVFSRLAPHPDKYMVEFNITGLTQREKNATKATSRFFPPVNTGAMLSFPCSRGPFVEFVERREFRGEVRVQELLPVFLPKLRTFPSSFFFFFFFFVIYITVSWWNIYSVFKNLSLLFIQASCLYIIFCNLFRSTFVEHIIEALKHLRPWFVRCRTVDASFLL